MFRVVSLDFYGTLVEVVAVYNRVCNEIIDQNKLDLTASELSFGWRQAQRTYEQQDPPPAYTEIIRLGLEDLSKKMGFTNKGYHEKLFKIWGEMPVYPEVPETLKKLKKRYPLIICSNSSRGFYELCAKKLPVEFDKTFLSEEVGHAKPHPEMYRQAIDTYKINPREVFHVASSQMDVKGTKDFGYTTCWLNRHNEKRRPQTPKPDYEIQTFDRILEMVE